MLSIAWKDLLILFKDRNNLVGAFLLPVVFIVVFLGVSGLAAGGGEASADPEKVPLAVVDNDGGEAAATLRANLDADAGLAITVYPEAEAMTRAGDLPRSSHSFSVSGFRRGALTITPP